MSSQRAYNLHGYSYSSAVLPCNHQPLTRERMAGGDIWVQWFTCCVTQQPPPRRRRPPIDRSMIGLPQNFQHTAHIGSSDVAMGSRHLVALQNHMQSKGGYDTAVPIEDTASRQAPSVTVT
uniref:CRIB domain-containing protein n=1 Tax=Daphnia galeata TaxID=27404 RepID=A0A8J2S0K0_9CRUS|nr:unnamed protein product [Daphnia galeata]